jgi:DNA-binding response OmpR family regulator
MNELDGLSALIIEPHAGMRATIHNMLTLCGLNKVDHAGSSNQAVKHLGVKHYDLILCEYGLEGGQDGQQLLEDVRHHKLMPLSTMFFMVTAEGDYGKVVSAAELGPTDYILKPFTADRLVERIARGLDRRNALLPVTTLMEQGSQREAIDACIAGEAKHPRYLVDFMRLRAELHMFLGEPEQAEPLYRRLVETKAIAWARLGLAKTLFLRERFGEARELLEDLVDSNRNFVDAYDWLARTQEAVGELDQAQATLTEAVAVSPHAVRRLIPPRRCSSRWYRKPSTPNSAIRRTMCAWCRRWCARATRCRPPPSSAISTSRWPSRSTQACAARSPPAWCTNTPATKRVLRKPWAPPWPATARRPSCAPN